MCREKYYEDEREPPCDSKEICNLTQAAPFELAEENKQAWEIYCDIVSFSSPDFAGLPTIDKIDFYFKYYDFEFTKNEFQELLEKIKFINNYNRYLLSQKNGN